MVLLVIALVGLAMAGTARRVLVAGRDARGSEAELQRRWAMISAQVVALENAEKLLEQNRTRAMVTVGGFDLEIRIADEAAKLPAGALVAEIGKDRAERAVRELVRRKGQLAEVRLDVWSPPAAKGEKRVAGVQSLGQVFPTSGASPEQWLLLGQWITTWGDGGVDPRRAPPEVVAARCGTLLSASQVSALQAFLAADSKMKVDDAMGKLSLTDEAREKLGGKLVDASACSSVWVIAGDGRRRWYRFGVKTAAGDAAAVTSAVTSFEW